MREAPTLDGSVAGTEDRARAILRLNDLEEVPNALPIRADRMWRKQNYAPIIRYTGSILIPMGHAPDIGVWRDSMAALVRRHQALHSRLAVVKDRGVLIPVDADPAGLQVMKASRRNIANHNRGASALSEFFDAPIDLLQQPGFQLRAFRDEDDNVTLGILMHHYFGDAWSSKILWREIATAKTAIARRVAPEWAPVLQYSEYALSQRRRLAKNLPAQLAYWRQILASARPTELPFDSSGDASQQGRVVFSISGETLGKLLRFSAAERISLTVIGLAAFQMSMARWCGQDQAMTALTVADRFLPQFHGTVGRLIGGIPIYTDVPGDMPIREFLSGLAKYLYAAMANRDLAFEQYDEIFSPPGPFCPTRFNFIPYQEEFSTGGDGGPRPDFSGIVKLTATGKGEEYSDILFILMQYADGMMGKISYNPKFSYENIVSYIGIFTRILEGIADLPDGKLVELR
jgi:hypothetical protein